MHKKEKFLVGKIRKYMKKDDFCWKKNLSKTHLQQDWRAENMLVVACRLLLFLGQNVKLAPTRKHAVRRTIRRIFLHDSDDVQRELTTYH